MKANELRIGSLVSQNGFFGYVYSIESALPRKEEMLSDKDLVTLFDNGITTVPIDEIKPIPLTKYWLKRLGFEEGFHDTDMRIQVSIDCSMSIWICDKTYNCLIGYDLILTIKYVHQLQNLYFALTGVELELSSNVA